MTKCTACMCMVISVAHYDKLAVIWDRFNDKGPNAYIVNFSSMRNRKATLALKCMAN